MVQLYTNQLNEDLYQIIFLFLFLELALYSINYKLNFGGLIPTISKNFIIHSSMFLNYLFVRRVLANPERNWRNSLRQKIIYNFLFNEFLQLFIDGYIDKISTFYMGDEAPKSKTKLITVSSRKVSSSSYNQFNVLTVIKLNLSEPF